MTTEILVLRIVHILGGTFWVGSGLFTSLFLMPVLFKPGTAAGQVLGGLQSRKLFLVLPIVALLTIVTGARLMWIMSAGSGANYFASRMGQTFGWSGLAALVAFLLSVFVSRPAMVNAGRLAAELGTAADDDQRARLSESVARLRKRGGVATRISMVLLLISASGMAVARYL